MGRWLGEQVAGEQVSDRWLGGRWEGGFGRGVVEQVGFYQALELHVHQGRAWLFETSQTKSF